MTRAGGRARMRPRRQLSPTVTNRAQRTRSHMDDTQDQQIPFMPMLQTVARLRDPAARRVAAPRVRRPVARVAWD